jgi:putative tricarboxylic transport membrane protein
MKAFRLSVAVVVGVATFCAAAMASDGFPSRTIEVVTHAGAGGGTDVTSRMMMLRARRELNQDMVVVNKRGGNGAMAMDYFMERPADGHTILVFTTDHAIAVAQGKSRLKLADLRPIARGTDDPQILMVNCKTSRYRTAEELVAGMKGNQLRFGTTFVGGIDHITAYVFARKGGLKQPGIVPFKGGVEVATQLVAGTVDVGVLNLSEAVVQIRSGDICPLIVLDTKRISAIPKVKTAKELGINAIFSTVRGFVTHAGVNDAHAETLERGLMKAMDHALYKSFLTFSGLDETSVAGAKEWGDQIKQMIEEMELAIKEMGLE